MLSLLILNTNFKPVGNDVAVVCAGTETGTRPVQNPVQKPEHMNTRQPGKDITGPEPTQE